MGSVREVAEDGLVLPLKRLAWADSIAAVGERSALSLLRFSVALLLKRLAWADSIVALGKPSSLPLLRFSVVTENGGIHIH